MNEIMNAKITNVSLSMRDHGCLTFNLTLEGSGWAVVYGGYCIGKGCLDAEQFTAESGSGLEAMMRIMDTVGVDRWEDLKGQYIRVKTEGWGKRVDEIGNLIREKWFNIREFFREAEG